MKIRATTKTFMTLRPQALIVWLPFLAAVALGAVASYLLYKNYRQRIWLANTALVLQTSQTSTAFPLQIATGQRYLIDQKGTPFIIQGDAGWSVIGDLRREEVDIYLADRRARGFNTLLVNLIEHRFSRNAPANAYGDLPFGNDKDFSKPNDAYFRNADWVLRRAREMGFLVLLAPSWVGYGGGDDGWWDDMLANGPQKLRAYGRFLGQRYGDLDNIIWVDVGDYDPPNRSLVEAVAMGIKDAAPKQLHTAHNAPETRIDQFWKGAGWLDINNVYTYQPVCDLVRPVYASTGQRPFFLIESNYENEHGAGAYRTRVDAYQALLCGAGGQVFGNNPVWHFNGPGLFPFPADWWKSLGSAGAISMTRLNNLIHSVPWPLLVPDESGELIREGKGQGFDLAAAARTSAGSLAVIYVPTARSLTINLASLAQGAFKAQWFDPFSGSLIPVDETTPIDRSSNAGQSLWRISTPGSNAGGDADWVLLITIGRPNP